MFCSEATIRTAHAGNYLSTLCERLGVEAPTGEDRGAAELDMEGGRCKLEADAERLVIACSGGDEAAVGRMRETVQARFPEPAEGDLVEFNWHTVEL